MATRNIALRGHCETEEVNNRGNVILEMIAKQEVKDSEVFSILADETKDLGRKEQLSLALRYYFNGAAHRSFLDFEQVTQLDAEELRDKIIHNLEKYRLEYKSNLVRQGYNAASVMSGKHSGVADRKKAKRQNMPFTFTVMYIASI